MTGVVPLNERFFFGDVLLLLFIFPALGLQWALAGTVIGPISAVVAVLMRAVVSSFEIGYAAIGMSLRKQDSPSRGTENTEELSVAESVPTD